MSEEKEQPWIIKDARKDGETIQRKAIRRRERHFTHDLTGQDEELFYE
jgi:hypothetical protein